MLPRYLHFAVHDKAIRHLKALYPPALPGSHRFIVIETPINAVATQDRRPVQHMELSGVDRMVAPSYWGSSTMQADCAEADIVVLHALKHYASFVLKAIRTDAMVIWNSWGDDVHGQLPDRRGPAVLDRLTQRALQVANPTPSQVSLLSGRHRPLWRKAAGKLRRTLVRAAPKLPWHPVDTDSIDWQRIDYISAQSELLPQLRAALPRLNASQLPLDWYCIERLVTSMDDRISGGDIMVGHAAWPSDNHAAIIALLTQIDLSGRRIVLPLNYGNRNYGDVIERMAREHLRCDTVILREFLPLDEYTRISQSCAVMITASRLTAGFGGILPHLYRGGKLVLHGEDPLSVCLARNGVSCSQLPASVEELEGLIHPLDSAAQERNRQAILQGWGMSSVSHRISQVYHRWSVLRGW